jgi:hypothetical protein
MTEVSSPQAASSLLGMALSTSSINTIFCFVRGAICYQESALIAGHNATETEDESKAVMPIKTTTIQEYDDNSENVIIDIGENSHTGNYVGHIDFEGAQSGQHMNIPPIPSPTPIDTTGYGEQEENDTSVDVIGLDGASPEVADILIHGRGIIGNVVEPGMPSLADHVEAENDDFAIVYVINDTRVPIAPHTQYRY